MKGDIQLNCVDCGNEFTFTEAEQQFYAQKQLSQPKRCKDCRAKRKAQRQSQGERGYR